MPGALSGRTAIVIGAACTVGAAVSCALSRAGASVVLAATDIEAISALATDIGLAGGHAVAVPTDVTNPMSVRRLVEQTLGAFGRLDAAINHAQPDTVTLAMKYEIPPMCRARSGHIVNLALTPAGQPAPAGVQDFADCGIRIHAVSTGPHDRPEDIAGTVVRLCSGDAPPDVLNGQSRQA
ncbi:MAG: SDR family NAD(P)-dependent oxidoreductase [Kibdelosporangium sp.]